MLHLSFASVRRTSTRPIPKVGVALLVFGGCYTSREGPGPGGANAELLARSYCEELAACDASYVDYAFGGLNGCTEEVSYWLQYDADETAAEYGAPCRDAYLDYFACFVDAIDGCYARSSYEESFFVYDYDALDLCQDAFLDVCPAT